MSVKGGDCIQTWAIVAEAHGLTVAYPRTIIPNCFIQSPLLQQALVLRDICC